MTGYDVLQGSASYPLVFLMIDSTDHVAGKAGLTVTVTISKNGGAFASPAGAVAEIGSGWYKVAGNATDAGTLGPLLLHATATGADPTDCLYPVVAYNPQSAGNLGLTNLDAAVSTRLATSGYTAPDNTDVTSILASVGTGLKAELDAVKAKTDNLPASFPANFASQAISGGGAVTVGGYSTGQDPLSRIALRTGTAQAGTATTITLDAGASAFVSYYVGAIVVTTGGAGAGQARVVTGYSGGATPVATVDRPWVASVGATTTFAVFPADAPSVNFALQVQAASTVTVIQSATATGGTANTITLASGSSAVNNIYNNDLVVITGGAGAGQSRTIAAYNGSTRVATVSPAWASAPNGTSTYNLLASLAPSQFSAQGIVAAATSTTITLDASASSTSDVYANSLVTILSGTGSGQTRTISAYAGSTRVATLDAAWTTTPDATSAYAVIPSADQTAGTMPSLTVADVQSALTNQGYTTTRAGKLDNLDLAVSSRSTFAGGAVASVTAAVTVGTNQDKADYTLSASGLDSIGTAAPAGVASNFREMVVQVWRRYFRKAAKSAADHTLKTYADDGTTVLTAQSWTDDGAGNETLGAAS